MKTNKIAQYCCAALAVAGLGLNIQNAIENYGIGENSLSLVASGGTGSSGPTSCSESYPTRTSSTLIGKKITLLIRKCGSKAGKWALVFKVVLDGVLELISENQETHQLWLYGMSIHSITQNPDGSETIIYRHFRDCTEYDGSGGSNCDSPGAHEELGIY